MPIVFLSLGGHVAEAQVRREFTEVHMGVSVRLVVHAPSDRVAASAARAAFARVAELDGKMSDYRAESEVRRLGARAGEWVAVSDDLFRVLARAVDIARLSRGAFDPTVGPIVALWRESRATGRLPPPEVLERARAAVGWHRIALDSVRRAAWVDRGVQIDLGGIAKGYALQEAVAVLRAHGAPSSLVEAGGDIALGDAPPGRSGWSVAVAGADSTLARRTRSLSNVSVATSGASAQFVEVAGVRYSHVIDPRTGLGVTSPRIVTVIAADGATADAAATALSVLGPEAGTRLIEALQLTATFRAQD